MPASNGERSLNVTTQQIEAFEQYAREVYSWAYRVLGRHHDALDVVQDVFLRWNAQCREGEPSRPRGWLRRVTLNRAIDLRRSHPRMVELDAQAAEVAGAPSDDQTLDMEQLRRDLTRAMGHLTDMQRSVLVAKVYDGLTFAEIAVEHDLAISTVKTHYLRAIRSMSECLGARWADDRPSEGTMKQVEGGDPQ